VVDHPIYITTDGLDSGFGWATGHNHGVGIICGRQVILGAWRMTDIRGVLGVYIFLGLCFDKLLPFQSGAGSDSN
jgi:hypothetical protein